MIFYAILVIAGLVLLWMLFWVIYGNYKFNKMMPSFDDGGLDEENEEKISINDIVDQATEIIKNNKSQTTTAYIIEKIEQKPSLKDINRVAGTSIGISDENWPMFNDEKMAHVITIDLNSTPDLKKQFPNGVEAFALFISNFFDNQAYVPMNNEAKCVMLTKLDLEKGTNNWVAPVEEGFYKPEACIFKCHEVVLPVEVFDEEIYNRKETDPIYILSERLTQYPIAGGRPIWLQSPQHEGNDVILQFDEGLVDINLGDGGVMYVFKDTAFWQCH